MSVQRSVFVTVPAAGGATTSDDGAQQNTREIHVVEYLPATIITKSGEYSEEAKAQLPTVYCLHGLSRTHKDFDFLGKTLASKHGFRVLNADNIGRGLSSWSPSDEAARHDYTIASYMELHLAVLDELKVATLHAWIGQSQGGFIGIAAAARHDSRIERLILVDVAPELHIPGIVRIMAAPMYECKTASELRGLYLARFGTFSKYSTSGAILDEFVSHHARRIADGGFALQCDPRAPANVKNEAADVLLNNLLKEGKKTPDDVKADPELNWLSFRAISNSTAISIVRGAESDLCTPEIVEKCKVRAANWAGSVDIPDAGHCPLLWTEAEVELVMPFLK